MFASQIKFQTAVRLAAKAWMLFMETGSQAALRSYQRVIKKAESFRVPSGPCRAELWIDIEHHHEYLVRVNSAYIACGMPIVIAG